MSDDKTKNWEREAVEEELQREAIMDCMVRVQERVVARCAVWLDDLYTSSLREYVTDLLAEAIETLDDMKANARK